MQTLKMPSSWIRPIQTGAQLVATYYWEKAYKDHRLLPAEQLQYVMSGIAATDRALALNPDYVEALTYKNLLLRMRANLETDQHQLNGFARKITYCCLRPQPVRAQRHTRVRSAATLPA